MNVLQALVLGIVQGLTEFLPISSSGHLIILPEFFGWETQPLVFDTTLHVATALALIVYFRKDLVNIFTSNKKLGIYMLIGSIPAGILGYLLQDSIENTFRSGEFVVWFLLAGTVLMFLAEKFKKSDAAIDNKKSFVIGLFQALALFPGVSRSGATISGGMLFGLSRREAARFSFLLSIPIVLGAGLFKILDSAIEISTLSYDVLTIGFLSAFIAGMFAIKFMLRFLNNNSLNVFIIYRILLVIFLLLM